jgi:hypothetical protein
MAARILFAFSDTYLTVLMFSTRIEIETPKPERIRTVDKEITVALSEVSPPISPSVQRSRPKRRIETMETGMEL